MKIFLSNGIRPSWSLIWGSARAFCEERKRRERKKKKKKRKKAKKGMEYYGFVWKLFVYGIVWIAMILYGFIWTFGLWYGY